MEASSQLYDPGRFTPREKGPWYPVDRRLLVTQSRSGHGDEEKNSQLLPRLEPRLKVTGG
jgi:hypothetical protein